MLDLACNHLDNLPTSLTKLQLWLAENQSKPLPCLQTDSEGGTGCSVITCCLLPQDRVEEEENWVVETTKLLNMKFNQLKVQDSHNSSELESSLVSKKKTEKRVQYRWPGS